MRVSRQAGFSTHSAFPSVVGCQRMTRAAAGEPPRGPVCCAHVCARRGPPPRASRGQRLGLRRSLSRGADCGRLGHQRVGLRRGAGSCRSIDDHGGRSRRRALAASPRVDRTMRASERLGLPGQQDHRVQKPTRGHADRHSGRLREERNRRRDVLATAADAGTRLRRSPSSPRSSTRRPGGRARRLYSQRPVNAAKPPGTASTFGKRGSLSSARRGPMLRRLVARRPAG